MKAKVMLVLVTTPSQEVAKDIASKLLQKHLAACVNIIPGLISMYHWQGSIQTDNEVLLKIKTNSERLAEVEAEVTKNHPYEVPEFLVLEPQYINPTYKKWALSETKLGETNA